MKMKMKMKKKILTLTRFEFHGLADCPGLTKRSKRHTVKYEGLDMPE